MKRIYLFTLLAMFSPHIFSQSRSDNFAMLLHDDWRMQSSLTDKASGGQISQPDFAPTKWYKLSVPSTIIGGLLANHEYNFAHFYRQNFEKLADKRLDQTWWFRKEFELPSSEKNKNVILKLHGINYKANLWLNGVLIADSTYLKGPFRIIDLDLTREIKYEGKNVLAIEILRPFDPNKHDGDLAIDYADWIHYPPDYNGGIVNNVEIKTYDQVGVRYPLVTTKFDLPSLEVAHLTVDAELINYTNEEKDAVVKGKINDDVQFEQKFHLAPHEKKQVTFSPAEYPQLNIKNPRIWWP